MLMSIVKIAIVYLSLCFLNGATVASQEPEKVMPAKPGIAQPWELPWKIDGDKSDWLESKGLTASDTIAFPEAEAFYRETIRDNPRAFWAIEGLLVLAFMKKEGAGSEEALRISTSAIKDGASTPGMHYLHGVALRRYGRNGAALTAFAKAVALAPKDLEPQFQLAKTHDSNGDYTAACEAYEVAMKISPKNHRVLLVYGMTLSRRESSSSSSSRHLDMRAVEGVV